MGLADLSASGSGSPFSGNSIAPNFTTSQTNAQRINTTQTGPSVNLGSYFSGTGPTLSTGGNGGGMKIVWTILGIIAVLGGGYWLYKKFKKPT